MSENDRDELHVRPGSRWDPTVLEGEDRCRAFGHELDHVLTLSEGLLVAYCVRCPQHFEAPWFKGGTAAALAEAMVREVEGMRNPAPSVLEDLQQVLGLLTEDRGVIDSAMHKVRVTMMRLQKR